MVRRSRARSSSLFLMELILAILFFSVASAVCVQFFVKSHLLSRDSDALNHAVNECSGATELMRAAENVSEYIELLKAQYPEGAYPALDGAEEALSDITITLHYDEAFGPCTQDTAAYELRLHLEQKDQLLLLSMQVTKPMERDTVLYELNTSHHIARRTAL